jgi:hypothetical protein
MLNYSGPGKVKNVATAATTLVHTGGGVLKHVTINGGTLTGTIAIYDGVDADGTLLATIGANQVNGNVYPYDVEVETGICVVSSANVDFTVCYND